PGVFGSGLRLAFLPASPARDREAGGAAAGRTNAGFGRRRVARGPGLRSHPHWPTARTCEGARRAPARLPVNGADASGRRAGAERVSLGRRHSASLMRRASGAARRRAGVTWGPPASGLALEPVGFPASTCPGARGRRPERSGLLRPGAPRGARGLAFGPGGAGVAHTRPGPPRRTAVERAPFSGPDPPGTAFSSG